MSATLQGKAILLHGGGPTRVLNASLAGVCAEARAQPAVTGLYGARNGVVGLLNEDFVDLGRQSAGRIEAVGRTPGSALGSSRRGVSEEDYERAFTVMAAHDVRYCFLNGGNGTMELADQLARRAQQRNHELRVIGIPKTIDNDLPVTDHTPGYGSAARFFACALRDIGADSRGLPGSIEVVEVMGRDVGWLVAATALARHREDDAPHLIYLPERRLPVDRLLTDVEAVYRRWGRAVIAVAEGQLDDQGEPFGADLSAADTSRHRLTGNLAHMMAERITAGLGVRSRSSKPRLLGRASVPHVSETDWREAYLCGQAAVRAAVAGHTDKMVTLEREPGAEYVCTTGLTDLSSVGGHCRYFPEEWIAADGAGVAPEFLEYLRPLTGPIEPHAYLEDISVRKEKS